MDPLSSAYTRYRGFCRIKAASGNVLEKPLKGCVWETYNIVGLYYRGRVCSRAIQGVCAGTAEISDTKN